ncbi:MAG: type I-G CRISPR-associated helicase/endonuclease Cas3g [Acidimicrobiia bacterium]
MTSFSVGDFPAFFEAVRNHEPFEWQQSLLEQLVGGLWPSLVDVPTGLGKTSVMDIWAYALAMQRDEQHRAIPLRLCFVVDRRIVVDAAEREALALKSALEDPPSSLVRAVAESLRLKNGLDALIVCKMRGGATWDSRWLRRPDTPAVISSTVDQFGSRLLFRGYGVSPAMRPINAALVGLDTWIVLDEAHISKPLAATVHRVANHQRREAVPSRAVKFTRMTATGEAEDRTFRADLGLQMASDRFPTSSRIARQRLSASKPGVLVNLAWLTNRDKWKESADKLGKAMAQIAIQRVQPGQVAAVVCNTVGTARAAFESLKAEEFKSALFTGRSRAYEREKTLQAWLPSVVAGAERNLNDALVLVATQTIEVGANLDFDFIVTELAPMSALVQRFGRVNRLGLLTPAPSYIVRAPFSAGDDPIYGESTEKTWLWLREFGMVNDLEKERHVKSQTLDPSIDFGILALRERLRGAPAYLEPEAPLTPIALSAHFERWAQTKPAPVPDQPVAPFLHGSVLASPDVSVAWRAIPPTLDRADEQAWQEWIELVAPVDWEFVDVPIWEARALITSSIATTPTSDLEGATAPPFVDNGVELSVVLGVVYRGRDEIPLLVQHPRDVRPGDRLVLASEVGGHDEWGWTGHRSSTPVADVADLAPIRLGSVARISAEVAESFEAGLGSVLAERLSAFDSDDSGQISDLLEAMPGPYQSFSNGHWRVFPYPAEADEKVVAWLSRRRSPSGSRPQADAKSDDDETSTSLGDHRVPLDRHGEEVGTLAAEFATNLGLPIDLVEAVRVAGSLHDIGKADPRFQISLHLGDELAALSGGLLAKSGIDPRHPRARLAAARSGLPRGFRHEARSEQLADEIIDPADGVDRDLVLHLIASHHGWARPLMRPVRDPKCPSLEFSLDGRSFNASPLTTQVSWAHPQRFDSLNQRYGLWTLAFLETLVRLADMLCSEVPK